MSRCPFCDLGPTTDPRVLLENEHCVFTDLRRGRGALVHSGMILPKAHRETVFDLTEEEGQATFALLHRAKAFIESRCREEGAVPEGWTIGWNCGAVGGQSVFHAHLHVIPRFGDEPYAGRGLRHWLKSEANRR